MDANMPPIPINPPLILIERFQKACAKGKNVLNDFSKPQLKSDFLNISAYALQLLYGPTAPIVKKYRKASNEIRSITQSEITGLFIELEQVLNFLESFSGRDTINPISQSSFPPAGKNVFIIHGHDELNMYRLRNLLNDHFKLNSILMKKEPGMSRALLKKFEDTAAMCSFAFALITPDDQIMNNDNIQYSQARPNVIFEAGWFVGRLGIPRVCLLLKEGTEVHSDIDGISRIHFRDNIEEKVIDIENELKAIKLLQ